jgi:hypothetical protein
MTPAIRLKSPILLESRNFPTTVAEAPSVMKTAEKPKTKIKELKATLRKTYPRFSTALISATETPEMKDKYPGIKGRTQGEMKEMKPAPKAASKLIFSVNIS